MSETSIKSLDVNHQGNEYVILEYEEERNKESATLVTLRNKRRMVSARSKKCVSVSVEPAGSPWRSKPDVNSSRSSMFELGSQGWIFDQTNCNKLNKNALNLDREIDSVLNVNSTADVTLGGIKLTF